MINYRYWLPAFGLALMVMLLVGAKFRQRLNGCDTKSHFMTPPQPIGPYLNVMIWAISGTPNSITKAGQWDQRSAEIDDNGRSLFLAVGRYHEIKDAVTVVPSWR